MLPAVNLIDELAIAMINTKQSFLVPDIRYQSTIYDVSAIFLHWKKLCKKYDIKEISRINYKNI